MKKLIPCIVLTFLIVSGSHTANASLTVVGSANYGGETYNLIYDDTAPNGPIVWLDYSAGRAGWNNQNAWAQNIGSSLSVTLSSGFTTTIDWTTGWRLPDTVDGTKGYGFEGDPDGDGIYSYTYGYNLADGEMGHLFYSELGNQGYRNTDGSRNPNPGAPNFFLQNKGPFENLIPASYWSGVLSSDIEGRAWYFCMQWGDKNQQEYAVTYSGLAVHPGTISSTVPIPGAVWLLGSGLISLAAIRRRKIHHIE